MALIALRTRFSGAIALVWLSVGVGMIDTINAIVQSVRYNVFTYSLGVNWVIVTAYVPALLVNRFAIVTTATACTGVLRGASMSTASCGRVPSAPCASAMTRAR